MSGILLVADLVYSIMIIMGLQSIMTKYNNHKTFDNTLPLVTFILPIVLGVVSFLWAPIMLLPLQLVFCLIPPGSIYFWMTTTARIDRIEAQIKADIDRRLSQISDPVP